MIIFIIITSNNEEHIISMPHCVLALSGGTTPTGRPRILSRSLFWYSAGAGIWLLAGNGGACYSHAKKQSSAIRNCGWRTNPKVKLSIGRWACEPQRASLVGNMVGWRRKCSSKVTANWCGYNVCNDFSQLCVIWCSVSRVSMLSIQLRLFHAGSILFEMQLIVQLRYLQQIVIEWEMLALAL